MGYHNSTESNGKLSLHPRTHFNPFSNTMNIYFYLIISLTRNQLAAVLPNKDLEKILKLKAFS